MDYFPLLVDEAGAMITDVIQRFVDQEIMPIRDKLDDDVDHVLINELLIKMSALGVFNVDLPEEGAETSGPSLANACAANSVCDTIGTLLELRVALGAIFKDDRRRVGSPTRARAQKLRDAHAHRIWSSSMVTIPSSRGRRHR